MNEPSPELPSWHPETLRAQRRVLLVQIASWLLLPAALTGLAALGLGYDYTRPTGQDGELMHTWRSYTIAALVTLSFALGMGAWLRWLGQTSQLEVTAQHAKLRALGRRIMVQVIGYTVGAVDPDDGPRCDIRMSWTQDGQAHQSNDFFLDPEDPLMKQLRALPCERVNSPDADIALYHLKEPVYLLKLALDKADQTSTSLDPIFEAVIQTQHGLLDAQGRPYKPSADASQTPSS